MTAAMDRRDALRMAGIAGLVGAFSAAGLTEAAADSPEQHPVSVLAKKRPAPKKLTPKQRRKLRRKRRLAAKRAAEEAAKKNPPVTSPAPTPTPTPTPPAPTPTPTPTP